jgi:hypothetical protein
MIDETYIRDVENTERKWRFRLSLADSALLFQLEIVLRGSTVLSIHGEFTATQGKIVGC